MVFRYVLSIIPPAPIVVYDMEKLWRMFNLAGSRKPRRELFGDLVSNVFEILTFSVSFLCCPKPRAGIKKSNKIVVTYHNPPSKIDRIISSKNHLNSIDALIVVSSKQVEYFKPWVDEEKIHLVHHGIDTEFFHPVSKERLPHSKSCLFVGTHLRDFETLKHVIHKVNSIKSDIQFTIVTEKAAIGENHELKNTRVIENIREDELLELYRNADVLLLPIIDCTANNTLLEAMACGVSIITSDVGGVRDYVDNRCAHIVEPGNIDIMADQLLTLLGNDDLREEMSRKAREKSLQFDWKVIAERMKEVYTALFL